MTTLHEDLTDIGEIFGIQAKIQRIHINFVDQFSFEKIQTSSEKVLKGLELSIHILCRCVLYVSDD